MTSFAATWPLLLTLIKSVALLVVLLIFIAYVLYADRKIWAAVQLRRGPNVVGPFGLWQSFADMLKFVFKEPIIPDGANKGVFLLAPFVMGMLALSAWAVIPVSAGWAVADLNVGILYIFAISSLSVYGIIMGGWASNSKYPFLSALRSAAQMISYEVSIGFVIITVLLCAGSLNLGDIVMAQDTRLWAAWLVLAAAVSDVRDLFHFGACRNEPPALRSCRGGVRACRGFHGRIFLDALHGLHARRICGDHHHVRADDDSLPRRLAVALTVFAFHPGPRRGMVYLEGLRGVFHDRHGESLRSKISL